MSDLKTIMNELNQNRHQDVEFTEKLLKKYIPNYDLYNYGLNFYVNSCVNDENDEKLFFDNLSILGDNLHVSCMCSMINEKLSK